MSFKINILSIVAATLIAGAAQAATIVGYDIRNASPTGTSGQRFSYTGTTTPSAEGVPGTVDLIGGTGSLTDGVIPSTTDGLNFFGSSASPNASITLYFDEFIRLGSIDLFGFDRLNNAFGGAITGVVVTVSDFRETFETIGFGLENRVGRQIHDSIDLQDSFLSTVETDRVTLSNFVTDGVFFGSAFTLGEIAINEAAASVAPVPLPASGLLFLGGLTGFGMIRRRKKA